MAFSKEDTLKKVVEIIAEKLSMSPDVIKATSTFKDLGADSLDIVEVIMNFEEAFGIEIKDEEAEISIANSEKIEVENSKTEYKILRPNLRMRSGKERWSSPVSDSGRRNALAALALSQPSGFTAKAVVAADAPDEQALDSVWSLGLVGHGLVDLAHASVLKKILLVQLLGRKRPVGTDRADERILESTSRGEQADAEPL